MWEGGKELSVKFAKNAGLTASGLIEIKVKQRSGVTVFFFSLIPSYLVFQRRGA